MRRCSISGSSRVTPSTATRSDPGGLRGWRRVARAATRIALAAGAVVLAALMLTPTTLLGGGDGLDVQLRAALGQQGFTGRVQSTLEDRLGRPVDPRLANIGRLLWFDTVTGLNG